MAYNDKSLSRQSLGAASGTGISGHSSQYYYRTADTQAASVAAGYFNNARARLKVGDVIAIVASVGTTPTLRHVVVTAVPTSGNITVAAAT